MTLSSRHGIRNSSPGGLRPSTLPLGHGGSPQYWLSHVDGEETFFVSFKPPRPGTEPRTLAWKAAVLTTTLGPPPGMSIIREHIHKLELLKSFKYWAAVRGNVASVPKVPCYSCISYFEHAYLKINLVLISHLTGKCATQNFKAYAILRF